MQNEHYLLYNRQNHLFIIKVSWKQQIGNNIHKFMLLLPKCTFVTSVFSFLLICTHHRPIKGLLTVILLTVVSDKITRVFHRSGATQSVSLDIPNTFGRVSHAGLVHKLKWYSFPGQVFGLRALARKEKILRFAWIGK